MAGSESGSAGDPEGTSPGEAALRAALAEHGEELAGALDHAEAVGELVDLVVLTIATADEDEVERVTESLASLVKAVDGLSTEESVALAEAVGENAADAAGALETVLRLERDGHLDDLVSLAGTFAALDVDDDAVGSVGRLLGAAAEAESASEPVGLVGFVRAMRSADVRAGLGYLLALVRATGRSLREDRGG